MIHTTATTQAAFDLDYDECGDSYTQEVTPQELRERLATIVSAREICPIIYRNNRYLKEKNISIYHDTLFDSLCDSAMNQLLI